MGQTQTKAHETSAEYLWRWRTDEQRAGESGRGPAGAGCVAVRPAGGAARAAVTPRSAAACAAVRPVGISPSASAPGAARSGWRAACLRDRNRKRLAPLVGPHGWCRPAGGGLRRQPIAAAIARTGARPQWTAATPARRDSATAHAPLKRSVDPGVCRAIRRRPGEPITDPGNRPSKPVTGASALDGLPPMLWPVSGAA